MKQGQRMGLELTQKPAVLLDMLDMIDLQSFALSAEARAQKLIKKYGRNFKKIEEEVEGSIGGEDKEFAGEVLWAARWILSAS